MGYLTPQEFESLTAPKNCDQCGRVEMDVNVDNCIVCEDATERCGLCQREHEGTHSPYEVFRLRLELGIAFEGDTCEELLDYYETVQDRSAGSSRMAERN